MTPPLTQGEAIFGACHRFGCRLGRCFCFAEVSNGHPHPYTGEAEVCSKLSSALNGEIKFTVLLGAKHRVAVFNA